MLEVAVVSWELWCQRRPGGDSDSEVVMVVLLAAGVAEAFAAVSEVMQEHN